MGLRSSIANGLDRTVGPATRRRLLHREAAVRRSVINFLDVEAKAKKRRAEQKAAEPKPTPEQLRAQLIERLGQRSLEGTLNQEGLKWARNDPYAPHPPATLSRHEVLEQLHRLLAPRTYLEIGVRWGDSLGLSRTRSIGVDPEFKIRNELHCDLRTFKTTSDDFFERPDALEHFEGLPIDLAFIDGMHLSDFALRDFVNVERHCSPASVVVFDDMLPRNHLEGYRLRRTVSWAGDVYKVQQVLRRLRPDLVLLPLNTKPTGTLIVANLDPTSTVLADALPEVTRQLTSDDPQTVPDDVLNRSIAVDPEQLLASDVWPRLAELRDAGASEGYRDLWVELAQVPPLDPVEAAPASQH
ncbi:MAG: class I SAM-dependent methyltransferase [Micropruina sp.]|nr:class I SAM-dependent methyltransferase [Micropruina sp.]